MTITPFSSMQTNVTKMDLEAGKVCKKLYPMQNESPELRWSFIRRVYAITLVLQLTTVASWVVPVSWNPKPIIATVKFLSTPSDAGLACNVLLHIAPLIMMCPFFFFHKRYPVINYVMLGIDTMSNGFVILEAGALTALLVIGLTLYTFWAAKKGYDFGFLGPFLSQAFVVVFILCVIQVYYPFGGHGLMIYGCMASIVLCGYIVYDTDSVIKRYKLDEEILAVVGLHLNTLNLFFTLTAIFAVCHGLVQ